MTAHIDYQNTYQALFGQPPPHPVTWATSTADILNPGRGFMGAFDFTMQLQVGCPGGCLFCYVPTGARLTPLPVRGDHGQDWGYVVRNKANVIPKLKRHLESGELADKTLYWSGVTDPYAAPPAITRTLWQTFLASPHDLRPRRIVIQTRFRPDRDALLLQAYQTATTPIDGGPPLVVSYSIGTDRNDLIRAWEKATPLVEQRFATIQALRQAEIFVVATLSPFGLWCDLTGALRQFKDWGVAYLTCLFFKERTASANTPHRFLAYLRRHYPTLLDATWQAERVQEMYAVYGQECVLVGRAGFDSLVCPQQVVWQGSNHE